MRIGICVLLLGSLTPAESAAQSRERPARERSARDTTTTTAEDSTTARQDDVLPLAGGYEQLRARYRSFQPRDSTGAGQAQNGAQTLALDGLVVDETQTRLGRTFYDVFYRNWVAPEGAVNFTVVVQEQPAPGRGTVVSVRVNDETAFRVRLQPRTDFIERAARAAVRYAARRLKRSADPNALQ